MRPLAAVELWRAYQAGFRGIDFNCALLDVYAQGRHGGLHQWQWVEMFRRCQEVSRDSRFRMTDGTPTLLFRGSSIEQCGGLSWTPELRTARLSAHRTVFRDRRPAAVWAVEVSSRMFLARPSQHEIIVDLADVAPVQFEAPVESWVGLATSW